MSLKKNAFVKYYLIYVIFAAIIVFFVALGGVLPRSFLSNSLQMAIAILLSLSLSFVVGFLGELSLGHAGFMCAGAYLGGKVASILAAGALGNGILTFIISVLVGGIVAAVLGVVVGLPALRLKGDYLAIVTLAFCEIVRVLFLNSPKEAFGGAFGLETPKYGSSGISLQMMLILALLLVVSAIAVFRNIIRSKHGRAVTAIRDNEIAARATGVDVTKYKLFAFVVSSFFAGIAGVVYSYTQSRVQSSTFDYNYSIDILVMVVLGGMGSMNGSIISAAIITFLNLKLSTVLTGNLAVAKDLVYALILILIVIFSNAPSLRSFREKYNFRAIIERLRKKEMDPADIKNDAGSWDRIPTKIEMNEVLSTDFKVQESTMNPDKEAK
ncbi:MAG: branched-chain amino acid ABC transporter permease [Clostridia bacterium]|nr:branched-chain amino acid ABC transporter permease [Clostridia bacterium]